MRVLLSWAASATAFSDVLESACRSAGFDLEGRPAAGRPRILRGLASRLQQLAERDREQGANTATVSSPLECYLEHQRESRAPQACRPADPQAIADELCITAKMTLADLRRLRRNFALSNHPDRAGSAERDIATRRMMIANMLIDRELKRCHAARRSPQR
jgi:hypothetical protein